VTNSQKLPLWEGGQRKHGDPISWIELMQSGDICVVKSTVYRIEQLH